MGAKAIVMGYVSGGLELWAYPLQLISGYQLGFWAAGDTSETAGSLLLRRVTYDPEAITRTYIGPDFIVRERLFVPLNEQAILLTYTVECRHSHRHRDPLHAGSRSDVACIASAARAPSGTRLPPPTFSPNLLHRYSALIGSPQVISHDEVLNSAQPGTPGEPVRLRCRAREGTPIIPSP